MLRQPPEKSQISRKRLLGIRATMLHYGVFGNIDCRRRSDSGTGADVNHNDRSGRFLARSGHTAEPVPPKPHRLVADIDVAFKQQVLGPPHRQRIPDVHHHRQADYLGRAVEIAKRIFHPPRRGNGVACLKLICSDNAVNGHTSSP